MNKSTRFNNQRTLHTLHRWLALIVGVQICLWFISGVVMSWFHIKLVKGESRAITPSQVELASQTLVAPGGIIAQSDGVLQIILKNFNGTPVYITSGNGANHMYNARTGEKLSPLKRDTIKSIAERDFIGDAPIKHIRLLTKTPQEYRGGLPVWQIEFKDRLQTRLYISPNNGEVISRRNKVWRIYDFFWMLHIMDYDERTDSNNWIVKLFSVFALLFGFTGLLLVFIRLRIGQYKKDIVKSSGNRS